MKLNRPELAIESFSNLKALIIGDVMIDAYLWGKVERISPEAPVPIVNVTMRENRLGGAANVALNIRELAAIPILCTVVGTDSEGDSFIELLKSTEIRTDGIIRSESRITTTKTRVIGHTQQVLRIDSETDKEIIESEREELFDVVKSLIDKEKIDVVIFEDYDKGVITEKLIADVVAICYLKNIPVTVDPKKRNFHCYHHVTLFKPNLKELNDGMKVNVNYKNLLELEQAVSKLQNEIHAGAIMITLSEAGVLIADGEVSKIIPAHIRNIADVSGAGDTVISVASLAIAAGLSVFEAAELANLAGGLVCEKVGVVPINKEELIAEVFEKNIL